MRETASPAPPAPALFRFASTTLIAVASLVAQNGGGKNEVAETDAPPGMLASPGGKLELGMDAKELIELAKTLAPNSEQEQVRILRVNLSELGKTTVTVAPYLMGKYPVTNEQYRVFVQATGHRPPFHWWKEGRKDDFESRRDAIAKFDAAGNDKNIGYWEANWDKEKLPWAIPEGQDKHPVSYVSWHDALAFAAWAGMRLPTENEWLFAATGGKHQQFLWGDKFSGDDLKNVGFRNANDMRGTKPVGAVYQTTSGPYGHSDLVGGVWEWTFDDRGYAPHADRKEWEKEYERLKRDKLLVNTVFYPEWKEQHKLLKGGAYLSGYHAWQLRLGVRNHAAPTETQPAAGFRLAKSHIPARDMTSSRIKLEYDYSFFGNLLPNLDDQVGAERYRTEGELITGYDAVSLVPVNEMVTPADKRTQLPTLAQERPIIIGTLITTVPMKQPQLAPGLYTVYFRQKGMPAELTEALKIGHREMLAAKARAAKSGGALEPEAPKEGELDWPGVLRRYGIDQARLAEKGALADIKSIRLPEGDLEVSTETSLLVFRDNGRPGVAPAYVASIPTEDKLNARGGYQGAAIKLVAASARGEAGFEFEFGVPHERRHVVFSLPLTPADAPGDDWRLPNGSASR